MRVFRTLTMLTGLAVFTPSPPEPVSVLSADRLGDTATLATAASQTVSDMASFCSRQPGVCDTAGYVAGKIEAKAKYSVRLIYEWAAEAKGEGPVPPYDNQAAADPITTGTVAVALSGGGLDAPSTLRLDDLIPEWRGPDFPRKG